MKSKRKFLGDPRWSKTNRTLNAGLSNLSIAISPELPQEYAELETKVKNLKSYIEWYWIKIKEYTRWDTIKNTLRTLTDMNIAKDVFPSWSQEKRFIKAEKRSIIQKLINLIDNSDWYNYEWFWDKKEHLPTIIFWRWDTLEKSLRKKKNAAYHVPKKNDNIVPDGMLPASPKK